MATAPAPSPRASLLSGLRTGGVRSSSNHLSQSAALGGSFNIPSNPVRNAGTYYVDEDSDQSDDSSHNVAAGASFLRQTPSTCAVDGQSNKCSPEQTSTRRMNPNSIPFTPTFGVNLQNPSPQVQVQALQMQMMQMEIMRLQAIQAQQYQAELIAQAQVQQTQNRRVSFNPPASAGPLGNGFDLRSATLRRVNQAEQLKAQLGVSDVHGAISPAIGGKFGSRTASNAANGVTTNFCEDDTDVPTPSSSPGSCNQTTVISGGTSLGASSSNNIFGIANGSTTPPSKSDAATSWRRGGNSGSRAVSISTSPSVKVTPPPSERVLCTTSPTSTKARPLPLRFSAAVSQPMPEVTIDTDSPDTPYDTATSPTESSQSGDSASLPSTPESASSINDGPLSPREEATKKLYAGLGIGRPVPALSFPNSPAVVNHRMASQPLRQPRGPPSGADELGPKNFATRIRRKAIGGLGALMGARERREIVEVY